MAESRTVTVGNVATSRLFRNDGGRHFTDVTEELYRKFMGVNVDGYFWMAQAAIRQSTLDRMVMPARRGAAAATEAPPARSIATT